MAHRKLRQKENTSTWPANKSPGMCKTGHEHAANEETHKPRVHTRHDNMKACSQWKTQAACHTAQDITWMHAANKNTDCVQHHKTHVDRRARARANLWPHTHNETMRHQCPNPRHQTKTQDMSAGIQTSQSNMKKGTQTRECTDRARSKPYAHVKTGHDGSVRALSQNHEWHQTEVTEPWH